MNVRLFKDEVLSYLNEDDLPTVEVLEVSEVLEVLAIQDLDEDEDL